MRASWDGRAELVTSLLLRGASVDYLNKKGSQPLHLAVTRGHVDVIKVLLKAGASLLLRTPNNLSVVDMAVKRGDTGALKELLALDPDSGAWNDCGVSALNIAAREGHAGAIDVLVDAGANPDLLNADAATPLHLACLFLQPDSVRALLHRNADETICSDKFDVPEKIVGHYVAEGTRDEEIVELIYDMLDDAPTDRMWRRRGWLAMLSARRKRTVEQKRLETRSSRNSEARSEMTKGWRGKRGGGGGVKRVRREREVEEVLLSSPTASRRKASVGSAAEVAAGDIPGSDHVHPGLKSVHWTVTKVVDVADELVFRRIISYL